jgi:hypothetical protein
MSYTQYDRVKHLVEVEDHILVSFTVPSAKDNYENLNIAKNANITKIFVDNIFAKLTADLRQADSAMGDIDDKLGRLRWRTSEYDEIRILFIYDQDRTIIVLIKSNTSLSDTVDNILGYYYESEDTPKSLF